MKIQALITFLFSGMLWSISSHVLSAQAPELALLGGELTYSCSFESGDRNQMHEITLTLRRDCTDTLNDVPFDEYATINLFTVTGHELPLGLWPRIDIPLVETRIIEVTSAGCESICEERCVEEAVYKERLFIPNCPGGYLLAYQRCCRSEDLRNIQDAGLTGGTYSVHLSEQAIYECNSTPVFDNWADRTICRNKTYTVDHGATDPDGDSLAYRLFTPKRGANRINPMPGRLPIPPFQDEVFILPASEDDPFGNATISVDPKTGFLQLKPDQNGEYLYGLVVEEWRNGQLLSEVYMDYQVQVCPQKPPELCRAPRRKICVARDSMVTLLPDFIPADNCKYEWDPKDDLVFDPTDSLCTNPSYRATGRKEFTVIAVSNTSRDTGYVIVEIKPDPPLPDTINLCTTDTCATITLSNNYSYEWDPVESNASVKGDSVTFTLCPGSVSRDFRVKIFNDSCYIEDNVFIVVQDTTCDIVNLKIISEVNYRDTICDFEFRYQAEVGQECIEHDSTSWSLSIGGQFIKNGKGAVFTGTYQADPCTDTIASITVTVFNKFSCTPVTYQREVPITKKPGVTLLPQCVCSGGMTGPLVQNPVSCWNYSWQPDPTLIFPDPLDSSLVLAAPLTTTTYTVTVTNDTLECTESVTITVVDSLVVSIESDGRICNGQATVIGSGALADSVEWSYDPSFQEVESTSDTFILETSLDTVTIYLRGLRTTDCSFCSKIDSVLLIDSSIQVVADPGMIDTCLTDFDTIGIRDGLTNELITAITWSTPNPDHLVDPNDLNANPIIVRALPGDSSFVLNYRTTIPDQCNTEGSVQVNVFGDLQLDILVERNFCGDTAIVRPISNARNTAFEWSLTAAFDSLLIADSLDAATLFIDTIEVVYLRGIANRCTTIVSKIIRPKSKINAITVTPARICEGDVATIILDPNPGDSLIVKWMANDSILSETDTSIVVRVSEGQDTLRISYWAESTICPGVKCDSTVLIPIDTVAIPVPEMEQIVCTDSVKIKVQDLFTDGEIRWEVIGTDITSTLACPALLLPGPGSYEIAYSSIGPSCPFPADTIVVTIEEYLQLTPAQDTNIYICQEFAGAIDSFRTLSVSYNIPPVSLTWTDQDDRILLEGDSVITFNIFGTISRLTVVGIDSMGCMDSVAFVIGPYPCLIELSGAGGIYCAGKDITDISVDVTCNGIPNTDVLYEWGPASLIVSGGNTANPVFNAQGDFEAEVRVTDTVTMCVLDTVFTVAVSPNPSLILDGPEKILTGQTATFTASSNTDPGATYSWSTGATGSSITVQPSFGITEYCVTVTDANGCCSDACISIDVQECHVGIPNAFSPNNDNMNDVFRVRSNCPLEDFEMKIIDRWGKEIYVTDDQEAGWDGTLNGAACPPDAFAFCVIYRCPNEAELRTEIGNVSLLR